MLTKRNLHARQRSELGIRFYDYPNFVATTSTLLLPSRGRYKFRQKFYVFWVSQVFLANFGSLPLALRQRGSSEQLKQGSVASLHPFPPLHPAIWRVEAGGKGMPLSNHQLWPHQHDADWWP